MNKVVLCRNSTVGEYWALQGESSKSAFTNPMGIMKLVELHKDDVVVDIGAYIGEYSMWASQFAKKVYAYEASKETYDVLKKNKRGGMKVINAAVTGDNRKTVNLYLSKGIGVSNSIAKTAHKNGFEEVRAIQYDKAVKEATVVKIDVEGAEYDYNIIQPNLRAILLEFHPLVKKPWKKMALKMMNDLKGAGFVSLSTPEFKHGWDTNSAWVREL